MNKELALEKIKKCLALSKSANEHEASQALKHAQALMRKYEIEQRDIDMSDVLERCADRRMAWKLPDWQWRVADLCGYAFGCEYYKIGRSMIFVGICQRAVLAAYAFDVIYRQVSAARRVFLRGCTARKPQNRAFLADQYCDGWLHAAKGTVCAFACTSEEKKLVLKYMDVTHGDLDVVKPRQRKKISAALLHAGIQAEMEGVAHGKSVQLHHAMHGGDDLLRLGM